MAQGTFGSFFKLLMLVSNKMFKGNLANISRYSKFHLIILD